MIFSNNEDIIDSVSILAPLGKSDHSIIESTLICTVTKQTNYYLDYKNADFKSMSSMFDNIFNADILIARMSRIFIVIAFIKCTQSYQF